MNTMEYKHKPTGVIAQYENGLYRYQTGIGGTIGHLPIGIVEGGNDWEEVKPKEPERIKLVIKTRGINYPDWTEITVNKFLTDKEIGVLEEALNGETYSKEDVIDFGRWTWQTKKSNYGEIFEEWKQSKIK